MKQAILLIGGGLLQQVAVEIARNDLGLHVIVTDRDPNCHCAKLADEFFAVDTKDVFGHIVLARELAERKNPCLAGVFTQGNSVEITVSEAARAVGLPGLDPTAARQIAYKGVMRQILNPIMPMKRGVYTDFQSALAGTSGSPAFVVKPEDSSGSRGLTKVYDESDFTHEVFERARAESYFGIVVIEEMLKPIHDEIAEQSVETVWENGKGHWLNWVDRPFVVPMIPVLRESENGIHVEDNVFRKEYAIEAGHLNPAIHSAETQKQVEDMVMAAGHALGMTTGIFKCDVMLTKDGPRILETTARLSGGFDAQYTSLCAHGVNYIRGAMRMALGESVPWEDFLPKWHRHAVALSAFPKPGKVTAINGIESAMQIKGVDHVFPRVKVSDVIRPYTDCVGRPLFVIASGDSRAEAVSVAQQALGMIRIETEAV